MQLYIFTYILNEFTQPGMAMPISPKAIDYLTKTPMLDMGNFLLSHWSREPKTI